MVLVMIVRVVQWLWMLMRRVLSTTGDLWKCYQGMNGGQRGCRSGIVTRQLSSIGLG